MKKKIVAALLLGTMVLGACGKEVSEPGRTVMPVENGDPGKEDTPVKKEKDIPFVASGNSERITEGAGTVSIPDSSVTAEQKEALSKASLQIFANAAANEGKHPNVLLSPASIAMAFGMTENGACGDTLAQMEKVIGGGISIEEMNPLLYSISDRFNNAKDVEWNVANSIWFKDDGLVKVNEDFAAKALSWYGADIWKAPFDETTLCDINGWVSQQTKGMIPSVINDIPENARMYLINAMAFEGEWLNEYEENDIFEDMEFTNADGSKAKVNLLCSEENSYFTLGNGTGFTRDYKGGEYSFMGLIPEEGTDLDDYIAELADSNADLAAAVKNPEYANVVVQIPEFTDDYDVEMSDMLKKMGMEAAFDPGQADFSAMVEPMTDDPYSICINSVIHKTHIEVDRKGTRAAAVTAIEMTEGCDIDEEPYVYITLDRPFIYGIIDNETGLPVFLGCVNTL